MTPEELYELFFTDLEAFARFFLHHYLTVQIPDFHKEIYETLPKANRLILATPRGFGKSTICSVFYPLWLALFQKRQDICIISASETLAIEWLRKIKRELESNPDIQAFFGDLKSEKWTENHIVLNNKKRVIIRARGAGGQIRGFRPDCIILDDIETDETVQSEEQRKKLKDWLFKACLNTLLPQGQLIIVGTIIHPLSVLNDLLIAGNWQKKKLQAYKNGEQKEGKELWPELWPHKKLQIRKKEIGSWAFSSEFMNDPVSDETAPIKERMIRYWTELPTQYGCVVVVDPAYSEDEKADYKVAALIAIDQQGNRYLLSYLRNHKPTGEFIDGFLNLWLQHKSYCTGLGIPKGAGDTEFWNSAIKKAEDRKLYPPFVELKNTFTTTSGVSKRNKKSRIIAALQPLFEAGKYYIHADHIEARDELLTIGSSRWDDIVDTMAYAEQILTPFAFEDKEPEKEEDWEEHP